MYHLSEVRNQGARDRKQGGWEEALIGAWHVNAHRFPLPWDLDNYNGQMLEEVTFLLRCEPRPKSLFAQYIGKIFLYFQGRTSIILVSW